VTAPAVSIAIRAYRRRWLDEAIASVLGQSLNDLELVIYDDAGDLEDVVAAFDDPRIAYHRATSKRSASGRFAAAIDLCRGRYLGVLDDDDRYEPEFVERLVRAIEDDTGAGIAWARGRWDMGSRVATPKEQRAAGPIDDAACELLSGRLTIQPSLMLIRRAAYDAAQADQQLPEGVAPDLWVNVRVALAGWTHVFVDDPLVTRRWHEDQLARRPAVADVVAATWEQLAVDDPELDALRAQQHARALLKRAVIHLGAGRNAAARTDLAAAARADSGAWRRPRQAMHLAARTGPLARVAASAWFAAPPVRRRRELPPGVASQANE
jgi:hypothetical protein